MKEDFVQAIWRYQLFNQQQFIGTNGQQIQVLQPGTLNIDAGPDFISAKIIIDGLLWVGNVEIHVKSSDWNKHHHQNDSAYNNVILHVVYVDDAEFCKTANDLLLTTLELKSYIDADVLNNYEQLASDLREIPCKHWWSRIEVPIIEKWLERMCVSRYEQKCATLYSRLKELNMHWDQLFFEILSRQLGFFVNAEAMELLAQSIKIEWIQKIQHEPLSVEALLFGQAGMLARSFSDDYPNALKKEYAFLQKKYAIKPLQNISWKFSKLRPYNFPTIRIAQLSSIMLKHPRLMSDCLNIHKVSEAYRFFEAEPHEYWSTHYTFDKHSKISNKNIGIDSINQMILNTLCSLWILYARVKNEELYLEKAFDLMEELKPEDNRFVKLFSSTQYKFKNSAHSQGLRFLKEYYCDEKKCLTCSIGINGLKL